MPAEPRYDLVHFKGFLFLYRTIGGKCETLNWGIDPEIKAIIQADYNELTFLQSALISGSADIHSDIDIQAIKTRIEQIEHKND